jgi:nucleotide-binding universal stress UspA family protein
MKMLVPFDGSESASRALDHVLYLRSHGLPVEIHLLNVQRPVASGHARMFLDAEEVRRVCHDEGVQILAAARARLDEAGVPYRHHIIVGNVTETIVRFAKELGAEQIVMGSRGTSQFADLVLGSVANKVIQLAAKPVTLVP